jgi:hypothetical protein
MEARRPPGGALPGKEWFCYIASLRDATGQGVQILRNEAYLRYTAVTKDAAQRGPDESGFIKPSKDRSLAVIPIGIVKLLYIHKSQLVDGLREGNRGDFPV